MATETTTAEAAHTAAEAGHSAGHAVGMPQLDFTSFPNQIFWLVIALLVIWLIVTRIGLPRIAGILELRSGTIAGHVAKAEELKGKAVEAQAAYDKAIADARAEAAVIAAATRDEINAELAVAIKKADAEIAARAAESEKAIAATRASSGENIAQVARDTTAALVAALGGKADADEVTKAVTARMKG